MMGYNQETEKDVQSDPGSVTRLLLKWRAGDRAALDELTQLVYDHLHRSTGVQDGPFLDFLWVPDGVLERKSRSRSGATGWRQNEPRWRPMRRPPPGCR